MMEEKTFTVEEINFICVSYADTVAETISKIFNILPDIENKDLLAVGESVINKLEDMTDEEFLGYGFNELYSE